MISDYRVYEGCQRTIYKELLGGMATGTERPVTPKLSISYDDDDDEDDQMLTTQEHLRNFTLRKQTSYR